MLRQLACCSCLLVFTLACATTGAPTIDADDRVCIKPGSSFVSPYEVVTLNIDYEERRVWVSPETAVLYVDPKDERRPTQILWVVNCKSKMHAMPSDREARQVSDCLRERDEIVIRPKKGCSSRIFDQPIVIRRGDTAVASGEVNREMFARMSRELAASDKMCDGSSKAMKEERAGMRLGTGEDASWLYDVVVRMGRRTVIVEDPQIWIESDGGSAGGGG